MPDPAKPTVTGDADEMFEQGPPDAASARSLGGVHGLELGVVLAEGQQRPDREQLAATAQAVERHRGVEEAVHVERMDVLRRAVQVGERQVPREQLPDVLGSRVVDGDLVAVHAA